LRQVWIIADGWLVGRYVILPDHLHLFAAPNPKWEGEAPAEPPIEPPALDAWIRYWKSQFTKQHGNSSHRWQTDHWDRRLRTGESYADKWEYVRNNPVRHGLVAGADAWPHQGELNGFGW
jgi:putative transposase